MKNILKTDLKICSWLYTTIILLVIVAVAENTGYVSAPVFWLTAIWMVPYAIWWLNEHMV